MLIGHLGKDPEVRYTADQTPVANFSLATTEVYNRNGERVEQTEWHNIVAWRGLAEVAQKYLHKGKQVFIEGKIRTRSYDDKDGNKRYMTEIVADNFTMLGRREDNESGGNSGGYQQQGSSQQRPQQMNSVSSGGSSSTQTPPEVPMDDDLPF
jgi:single-strand DNA-binding protein